MEGLLYEKKVRDMQKYIPFLENLIVKLEKSRDGQTKSREAQLTKMRMLYGLLTKKDKKLKLDTLLKCESVLAKLHEKVEKHNKDSGDNKTKEAAVEKSERDKSKNVTEIEELSAPASPQNSDSSVEFHAPIVIPTERANSPNVSNRYKDRNSYDSNSYTSDRDKYSRHIYKGNDSKTELYKRRSPGRYDNSKNRYSEKSNYSYDKYESFKDTRHSDADRYRDRERDRPYEKNMYYERRPYSNSPNNEMRKSRPSSSTSSSNSNQRSSTVISPSSEIASRNRHNIFDRLGDKLNIDDPSNYENFKIKITNYKVKKKRVPTPLSEVLKSPPLSANDIDDLMNESGGKDEKESKSEMNDLEVVRKKLNNEIDISKKKGKEISILSKKEVAKPAEKEISKEIPNTTAKQFSPKQQIKISQSDVRKDNSDDLRLSDTILARNPSPPLPDLVSKPLKKSMETKKDIIQPSNTDNNGCHLELEKGSAELSSSQVQETVSEHTTNEHSIRLAYKYNPHPRRNSEVMTKPVDEPSQTVTKLTDPRINKPVIQTLPSVNLADPRLRNRPPPSLLDINIPSPTFSTQEVRRPQVHPVYPMFGNYSQQQKIPKGPVPSSSLQSSKSVLQPVSPKGASTNVQITSKHHIPLTNQGNRPIKSATLTSPPSLLSLPLIKPSESPPSNLGYNKFQMLNDQVERMKYFEAKKNKLEPKTYGEYRQARFAEQHKDKGRIPFDSYKSPPTSRRDSIDFSTSCLDKMYRKYDFKQDVPSVSNFKIPKVTKTKNEEADKVDKDKTSTHTCPSSSSISNDKSSENNSKKDIAKSEDKKDKSKYHSSCTSEKEINKKGKVVKKEKIKSSNDSKLENSERTRTPEKRKTIALEKPQIKTFEIEEKKSSKEEKRSLKTENIHLKDETKYLKEENKPSKKENKSEKDDKNENAENLDTKKSSTNENKSALPAVNIIKDQNEGSNKKETEDNSVNKNENLAIVDSSCDNDNNPIAVNSHGVPGKINRRRKSVFDIVPTTTDNSEISTQNIITGKRRIRSVLPLLNESPSPKLTTVTEERKSIPIGGRKTRAKTVNLVEHEPENNVTTNLDETDQDKKIDESTIGPAMNTEMKQEYKDDPEICAVSSTTIGGNEESGSVEVKKEENKNEITKEWLEGFLLNIFNPALMNKDGVLNMLEKVLDENKFKQIKKIMDENQKDKKDLEQIKDCKNDEKSESNEVNSDESKRKDEEENEIIDLVEPKNSEPKKKKSELDRLNEDIRDMFISKGVLTATGKRMCTIITEEKKNVEKQKVQQKCTKISSKHTAGDKFLKGGNKQQCKMAVEKPSAKEAGNNFKKGNKRNKRFGRGKKKRITLKRGNNIPPIELPDISDKATLLEEDNTDDDFASDRDTDMPVLQAEIVVSSPEKNKFDLEVEAKEKVVKLKKKCKPCPKSRRKIPFDSDEDSVDDIENNVQDFKIAEVETEQAEVIIEIDEVSNSAEPLEFCSEQTVLDETSKIEAKLKENANSKNRKPFWGIDTEINPVFKNTNPEIHIKSEYINKCLLCGFEGKRMCNHYIHAHPDSEIPISRLSPETLQRLKSNENNQALLAFKKNRKNTLFLYQCPFCDTKYKLTRKGWVDHFGIHTGEYLHKCSGCNRVLNNKQKMLQHIKNKCPKAQLLNLRKIEPDKKRVITHVCDLCNYLQMSRHLIVKHLQREHNEERELITAITLIEYANPPTVDQDQPMEIDEENVDRINEKAELKEITENSTLEFFEHSIFNDMSIVERLSERLKDNLQNSENNDITKSLPISNDQNIPHVEIIMDEDITENANEQSKSSVSIADRLCERFNASQDDLTGKCDIENTSVSMAEKLCQRFSTEEEKRDSDNFQSVVYVVDKIDEHNIATAEHVKAAEIKVPNNGNENNTSVSEIINQPLKNTVNKETGSSSPIQFSNSSNSPNIERSQEVNNESANNVAVNKDSVTSLVERIKMQLNRAHKRGPESSSVTEKVTESVNEFNVDVTNTPTMISPQKSISNHSTPKARMSIVERLSQRLKSTTQDVLNPELALELSKTPLLECEGNSPEQDNSFENRLIIDENADVDSLNKSPRTESESCQSNSSQTKHVNSTENEMNATNSKQHVDKNVSNEMLDDDNDDWEDIEILSPESDEENPKRQDKSKKNKLIFETFSRLYTSKGQKGKKEKNKKGQKSNEKICLTTELSKNFFSKEEKGKETNCNKRKDKSLLNCKDVPETTDSGDPNAVQEIIITDTSSFASSSNQISNKEKQIISTTRIETSQSSILINNRDQNNTVTTSAGNSCNTNSTITLGKDLGDISGFLGLNTNQLEIGSPLLQQESYPLETQQALDINDISSTFFIVPNQTSVQNSINITPVLNENAPNDNTGSVLANSVEVQNRGNTDFKEITQSNNENLSNNTSTKNDSIGQNKDSCSNGISSSEAALMNSPVIHRIDKLGYSKNVENVIKYHCLVESCSFLYSELPIGLQNHFLVEHVNVFWEGYCYSCQAQVCTDEAMSLSREYKHMMEVHVNSLTADKAVEMTEKKSKPPLIKLRRLSGDMLSVNQDQLEGAQIIQKSLVKDALKEHLNDELQKNQSLSKQNTPKIHNKTSEPEKDLPPLKITTRTILKVHSKNVSDPSINSLMLDKYLVRNNNPKIKSVHVSRAGEISKDKSPILNNPSSSLSGDLKITSVAQNVNLDLIHKNTTRSSEPFLKIKEVVSLSTSSANEKSASTPVPTTTTITTSSISTTNSADSSSLTNQLKSPVIASKPNVMQISISKYPQEEISQVQSSNVHSNHTAVLKPILKSSTTSVIPAASTTTTAISQSNSNVPNLKIQNVTSLSTYSKTQPSGPLLKDKQIVPAGSFAKLLKPWISSTSYKSSLAVHTLLKELSLYSLFKCMGNECVFSTNSAQIMIQHLKAHSDMCDKNPDNAVYSWRDCPYCTEKQLTNKCLVDHVVHVHGKDIYQCPYCFYRSCVDQNVIVHINAFHKNREKSVLVCFGEQRRLATEIRDLAKFRINNVHPVTCYKCSKSFFILRNYVKHIKEHEPSSGIYTCFLCCAPVFKNKAEKHLLTSHNIGVYECIYCLYATENMEMMRIHVANRHPSYLAYMCVRLSPNKNNDTVAEESLESSTVLANLAESVDDKCLKLCPYTHNELNEMNPLKIPKENNKENRSNCNSNPETPIIETFSSMSSDALESTAQNSTNLEITSVQSISNEAFQNLETIPTVEETTEIDACKINNDQIQSTVSSLTMKRKFSTTITPPLSTSSELQQRNITVEELQMPSESDIADRERAYIRILEAAKELVQSTGFNGKDLYKCAECEHPPILDSAMSFHLHVQQHIDAGATDLKCFHCSTISKNLIALKNHLKTHFGHRYFCYFCNFTGATAYSVIKHVADSHSKIGMVTYPLIFGQTNKTRDFFVVCPKTIKQIDIIQFGERMVRAWERKKALTKKYFTPDEIDLLPRQAIFFNEVHCQVCDYRTKVRTNMFRHLQFHKQEVKVATVDPVNPVPCLNSNERHFDKMVNLACSSNINKDNRSAGSSTAGVAIKEEPKLPEYVPPMKRYVCGSRGCTYLTISENMMKWHLSALHSDEKSYICPHCNVEICKKTMCTERVLAHLKFHDTKLFLCSICDYMHHQKYVVERHINEKHPTGPCSIISYERNGTDTIKSIDPVIGRKTQSVNNSAPTTSAANNDDMKWECGLCKMRRPTYNQMVHHMNRNHNVKNRYTCVHCDFGAAHVSNIVLHIAMKHPTKVKEARCMFYKVDENPLEPKLQDHTTPIWTRDPCRVKNIRGILMEDEEESNRNLRNDTCEEDDHHDDDNEDAPENLDNINTIAGNKEANAPKNNKAPEKPILELPVEQKSNKADEKPVKLKCEDCLYIAETAADLEKHTKYFNHKQLVNEMESFVFCCYYCSIKINTIQSLRKHWKMYHLIESKDDDELRVKQCPFWFKMFSSVACGYCSYKNEFQIIIRHHQTQHSGKKLALINVKTKNQCNYCSYSFKNVTDLGNHFSVQHQKITPPSTSFTDEVLELILTQEESKQKLIKCKICNQVPSAKESFNDHHNKNHPNTAVSYEYIEGKILYSCPKCEFISNEDTTLQHMYEHTYNCTYKCSLCDAKCKFFSDFVNHLDKVHKCKPNQSTITKCIENKIKQLNEVRIIFPNGLIVERTHLATTKYGNFKKLENIAKKEFSSYIITATAAPAPTPASTPPVIIPKIPDIESGNNSEAESLSSSVTTTSRSSHVRKRRQSGSRQIENIDKYDDDDDWVPSAKTRKKIQASSIKKMETQLQKLVKHTIKPERKPEKVDLSKIYTTMTIAGSDVPISCDRFAKLVKIHTRVRVEKLDMKKYLAGTLNTVAIGKRKLKPSTKNESNKKLKTS